MEYREYTALSARTSLLGFGCMRLPLREDGTIEREPARALLERARRAGVNYFDTAWNYTGGDSEVFLGEILPTWERESYYVATKLPTFKVETLEDAKAFFEEQLARLKTGYIDFYLLHTLNRDRFRKMAELGVVDWCLDLQRQGRIRRFGFSFHDTYPAFEEILSHHQWDFCQIQLNYLDRDEQAGMKGYELAAAQGVPVVIMEPVKGGLLAALPEDLEEALKAAAPGRSAASWALRWVGALPGVLTVLSGMSTMEQVEDNLATFEAFRPLAAGERALLERIAEQLRGRVNNGCTGCKYCMPCPAGVDIPENFALWNLAAKSRNGSAAWRKWNELMEDAEKAKHCVGCGRCEEVCPQHIAVRADLARAQAELDAVPRPC